MNNEWDIVKIQKVTFFMAHPLGRKGSEKYDFFTLKNVIK